MEPESWLFQFATDGVISTQCHWRILVRGYIDVSDDDHKQQFGLPEPIDAAAAATDLLSPLVVTDVDVRKGTLDLTISFGQDTQLQLIPFSSGYESWNLTDPSGNHIVAQGGGQLSSWKP